MKQLTAKALSEMISSDSLTKSQGVFVARRGFFYTKGYTAQDFSAYVTSILRQNGIEINVEEAGEVWKPFKGGASLAQQSHWYVRFTVK